MTNLALQTIRRRAQEAANRENVPMVVFNLNNFSPMYVVRVWDDRAESDKGFVERFDPEPKHLVVEICPAEPHASMCLANGESVRGSKYERDVLDCTASGDCQPACEYVRDAIGVDFRIVARNAAGEYENRPATPAEKEATCRAIYFESESDFSDESLCETYLIWSAASDVDCEDLEPEG